MAGRIIIHFGVEKTGSKALQLALKAASGPDFVYPSSPEGNWHRPLHQGLEKMDDALLRQALEEIGDALCGALSCEDFHRLPDPALALLSRSAGEAADETVAVVFLRRQDDYVDSFSNQMWKAHRVDHATAFRRKEVLLFDAESLDYERMLDRLETHYDRVIPLIYEKGVSTIARFAEATDLRLSEPTRGAPDPNPAATARELATLREVKRLAGPRPDLYDIVEATRRAMARKGPRRWLARFGDGPAVMLSQAEREAVMRLHEETNERVRRRWFPERDTLFTPSGPASEILNARPRADVVREIRRRFDF